jgi:hypothetical protein
MVIRAFMDQTPVCALRKAPGFECEQCVLAADYCGSLHRALKPSRGTDLQLEKFGTLAIGGADLGFDQETEALRVVGEPTVLSKS